MEGTILLVKIGPSLKDGKDYYEATRGNWNVSQTRIDEGEIQYVAGIDNRGSDKKVVCLYTPDSWHDVETETGKVKKRFTQGIEAPKELIEQLNHINEYVLSRFGVGASRAYIKMSELKL